MNESTSNVKKVTMAGILVAVAVVGSTFSFPVGISKCAPVQHMINILCAVLLGRYYGVGVAFCASTLRLVTGLAVYSPFRAVCGVPSWPALSIIVPAIYS